jgi:solute carrier family 25 (mitochondrial thiamine pyrophosphate transporter), member 19
LFVGAAAGVCSKTLVYPLDLAKKRLQIQGFSEHRKTFGKHFVCSGMRDCLWGTIKSEGVKGEPIEHLVVLFMN